MPSTLDIVLRLIVSVVLAGFIGWERARTRHPAGLRTHALVALGSTVFTMMSLFGFGIDTRIDPTRVAAQIIVGVGFLGAGIILHRGTNVLGLTTAASIWVAAAIGMTVGAGQYHIALAASVLTLFLLFIDDDRFVPSVDKGNGQRVNGKNGSQ